MATWTHVPSPPPRAAHGVPTGSAIERPPQEASESALSSSVQPSRSAQVCGVAKAKPGHVSRWTPSSTAVAAVRQRAPMHTPGAASCVHEVLVGRGLHDAGSQQSAAPPAAEGLHRALAASSQLAWSQHADASSHSSLPSRTPLPHSASDDADAATHMPATHRPTPPPSPAQRVPSSRLYAGGPARHSPPPSPPPLAPEVALTWSCSVQPPCSGGQTRVSRTSRAKLPSSKPIAAPLCQIGAATPEGRQLPP